MSASTRRIDYTEAYTLAQCEVKHDLKYNHGFDANRKGPGLQKGTLLHLAGERWLKGEGMTLPQRWVDNYTETPMEIGDFGEEIVDDVDWLCARYMEHYGETPPDDWEIVAVETPLEWKLPYRDVTVFGRADGLVRVDGKLWLRELKSYGRNSRLDIVQVSPQETTYLKGVEETFGERPYGILFDGIYTYRWKPKQRTLAEIEAELVAEGGMWSKTGLRAAAKMIQANEPGIERPAADSFHREWTDRNEFQVEQAVVQMAAIANRRWELTIEGQVPIANIGPSCNSCDVRTECFNRLLGEDWTEIGWEDDEED